MPEASAPSATIHFAFGLTRLSSAWIASSRPVEQHIGRGCAARRPDRLRDRAAGFSSAFRKWMRDSTVYLARCRGEDQRTVDRPCISSFVIVSMSGRPIEPHEVEPVGWLVPLRHAAACGSTEPGGALACCRPSRRHVFRTACEPSGANPSLSDNASTARLASVARRRGTRLPDSASPLAI